ncbi:glycosyltransferase [Candidatus Dojkabacteria bacterium]|nr:glycosyltransferase [Candidatus Dojkabacteria bacterium]
MQAGLPIIATNSGGQVDLIEENENGWLVNPEDPESLAEKIDELADLPDLRKTMSSNNLEKVDAYDIKGIASRYLSLLETVQKDED